eukprot:3577094-Prorocentrum_lima.AAC.1
MTSSLVGSEMCIRDRRKAGRVQAASENLDLFQGVKASSGNEKRGGRDRRPLQNHPGPCRIRAS